MQTSINRENIKIALVSFTKAARQPPIGLVYLATYLRNIGGIKNIKIIDNYYDNTLKEINDYLPDIIGMGPMTIHYEEASALAKLIKATRPTPIVLGGVHISTLPESLRDCFDVAVIGEGEVTFAELIALFIENNGFPPDQLNKIDGVGFKHNGKMLKTSDRKAIILDELPLPDYSFINKKYFDEQEIQGTYIIARRGFILTSRSCPYKCQFCSTSHFWGKLRLHSPEYTARLIKDLVVNYHCSFISILDDLFTISTERLKNIKLELEKLNILNKIQGMVCQPRANVINDDMCQVMKDLKIKIVAFGFESGSERILHWLKNGSVTVEMNKKAIILCKKYGFTVIGTLIFGSPGEKISDMMETIDFIKYAIRNHVDDIWSFVATPYPDTPFWDIACQRGKVSENMNFNLLSLHHLKDPPLLDEDVDKDQFEKIFVDARAKLSKLRIRTVIGFICARPIRTIYLLFKHPIYCMNRVVDYVFDPTK